jgi:CheY-like chemotaxis protein
LETAIVNLAVNARDAMPSGGRLTIETANSFLEDDYVRMIPEPVEPGQYVMVAVADTGTGMDQSTADRAFEPFFTTKEPGKGSGLGLSQVYGFVRQSRGHVRIYSEPGQGTCVKVYLPRTGAQMAEEAEADALPSLSVTGSETILVVEDDDDLRAYSTGILRDLGYLVREAGNAKEALRIIERHRDVQLLFTDVVLPFGLSGRELAEAAQRLCPAMKVLFTTGYSRNAIVHNGRLEAEAPLLSKPFTSDALARKLRALLDTA